MTHEENGGLKGLGVAAALVVGVLAAVGVSGDLLSRMVRNHPVLMWVPVAIAISAGTYAAVGPAGTKADRMRVVRTCAVVVGFALMFMAFVGILSLADREQPGISIALKRTALGPTIEVAASGSGLRSSEHMLLRVTAVNGSSQEEREGACRSGRREASPGTRLLSWTETGPNGKGEASTTATVDAPPAFSHYCAYAALVKRGNESTDAFRSSWAILEAIPTPQPRAS